MMSLVYFDSTCGRKGAIFEGMSAMKLASAVSDQTVLESGIEECVSAVRDELGGLSPDLAVVFLSTDFASEYQQVPAMLRDKLGPALLFGCSGGGVIGGGREVEHRPGFSLTAAHLPGVELSPFHLEAQDLPGMDSAPQAWEDALKIPARSDPRFLLLVDPFSFPAANFLMGMDYAFSSSVKIGGMASGGNSPGDNALFLADQVHSSGAIGLAMTGNIVLDTVVAQGCRPVGQLMSITKSQQNLLMELDQRPPLEVVRELFTSSSQRDQELMQSSLFLGILMDDLMEEPKQGDFLVRNVIGIDSKNGVMAIGEMLREGQRVQFHLRDSLTSADDLAELLTRYSGEERSTHGEGALLFSCLGRGEHLYGHPDHDTNMFRDKVGVIPLGGFFCNGEIGPVSGTTFLHGYTSSFGIFRPLGE